jgi:hypothetical protein
MKCNSSRSSSNSQDTSGGTCTSEISVRGSSRRQRRQQL